MTPERLIPLLIERLSIGGGGLLQVTFEIPAEVEFPDIDPAWLRWVCWYLELSRSGVN